MNQVVEQTKHAPFAPSSFKRKEVCPASHMQEKKYPDKSSDAAIDGTHSHTLLELCLLNDKVPADYVGQTLSDEEGEFTVDKARAERVMMAVTYVKNQTMAAAYQAFVTPEQKVDPGSLLFRDDWYGTADIEMVFANTHAGQESFDPADIKWIVVADYKDGSKPVYPEENYQGISYMLGVIAKYTPPMDTPIIFTIIQPKAAGIREWHTTVAELMEVWLPKCQEIIAICESPDATYHVDEEQCHYCLHKLKCDERNKSALEGINTAMGGINIGTPGDQAVPDFSGESAVQTTSSFTTLPKIGDMTDEQMSQVMMLSPIIRGWLRDIDEEALTRVQQGGRIPGYKMVKKSGRRSWLPDTESIKKALLSMSASGERVFKKADIVEDNLVSFTKILANPNLSDKQKKRIEDEFIKKPQGKETLVLETEKGKDISPAAMLENMPDVEMQSGESSQ